MSKSQIKKKNLGLVLPDGITLRNFVFSSFLKEAVKNFNVIIFHFVDKSVFNEVDSEIVAHVQLVKIENYKEFPLAKVYRYAKQKASLEINYKRSKNATLLRNFPNYKNYSFLAKLPYMLAEFVAKNPTQNLVERLEKQHLTFAVAGNKKEVSKYEKLLKKHQVDVLFNIHQRDVKSIPLVLAAKKLRIKSANFVYSWDNLPKGRMAVVTDYYFVWSEYMKAEMNLYYPDIEDSRIIITGTPQFEFYHTITPDTREEFALKYGLDPAKRWILYSGDMTDASPFDQHYLEDVFKAWENSKEKNNTQLLFRRAPTDLTGRFKDVLAKYPEIVNIEPLWKSTGNHQMHLMVSQEDVNLLVNLIEHCHTAVNFGSTMAHDFAQRQKRVYYLNYNHPAVIKEQWSAEIFYAYTHFDSLEGMDAVNWVNSKEEISKVFFNESNQSDQRISDWHAKITDDTKSASQKIISALEQIAL